MEALVQGFSDTFLNRNHHDPPYLLSGGDEEDTINLSPSQSSEVYNSEESDFPDATLKLISQMLMEEDDLENKPCMFQECLALQATEKSFYDALVVEKYPISIDVDRTAAESPDGSSCISSVSVNSFIDPSISRSISPSNGSDDGSLFSPFQVPNSTNLSQPIRLFKGGEANVEDYENYGLENTWKLVAKEKKTHNREDGGDYATGGGRSNKQLASSGEDLDEQIEMFDKVLLCPVLNPHLHQEAPLCSYDIKASQNSKNVPAKGVKGRGKKEKKEVVDLGSLLSQCAQSVASADVRSSNQLLTQIRQHSSPQGDATERSAHYFANALEARLAGTGTALYAAFTTKRISAADIVKGYQVYIKACPFNKTGNMFANRSIAKLALNAPRLHIIDFGILYGFQWPCLIQHFSVRSGGSPKLRITAIDFPQPGFRPAERVDETGKRLATYCKRFNVQFEYTAIAKKWDTIKLEDIKIDRDEVLVVNSLNRLKNVPDETVVTNSPRDAVLNLVKRINPNMFIHGVLNGTYNAPFFVTRFKEAVYHFSAGFDMFESTVPREDPGRMLYEKEVLGRDIMNVVACEGTQRVERPETYKQWQIRNIRAGFRQLPLNQEIVKDVRAKVKSNYNKNFVVDEDGNWMLQGWKGRIIYAISCWKPAKDF